MNELVSVIVPVYKVEQYLDKCVQSIVDQTYTNLEIILVDDGSPDNCPKMCDDWAEKDSRIKVIHKLNGGLSDARNAGLDIYKGEYIYFCDSDDYISENAIEVLYDKLIETDSDMAVGNYSEFFNDFIDKKSFEDRIIYSKDEFFFFLFRYVQLNTAWNKLYKRFIWESLRFPYGQIHEDAATDYLVLEQCKRIVCVNVVTYFYFKNSDGITAKITINTFDGIEFCITRTNFFLEHKYYASVSESLFLTSWYFCRNYYLLSERNLESKIRIKALHNEYKITFKKSLKLLKSISFSKQLLMISLYIHPSLAKKLYKIKTKKGK